MNLSFAGCGFLGIYHIGVACCIRKYAPHLLLTKLSGASAGAMAACSLLCDLPIGEMVSDILKVTTEARSYSLGPFSPSFNIQNIILEGLEKFLPEDAHLRVNGKLHISLTRVYDGKNVIISHFNSKEHLLQALLATVFIPIFSGIIPPKVDGVRYIDGGFSDNLPALDENTITVSPFCGESDICPRDNSAQLFHITVTNTSIELSRHNIYRIARILFPPKPEVLSNICKQGFDDALRFLYKNNLISCTRCLAVQSTFVLSEAIEDCSEYDPECRECKVQRQEALDSNMPDTVITVFQEAIDSANKGLFNWLFKHRGKKLLSALNLPYMLPADVVYATITSITGKVIERRTIECKVLGNAIVSPKRHCQHVHKSMRLASTKPQLQYGLWDVSKVFWDQLSSLVNRVNSRTQQLTAKMSCQFAVTQYGAGSYDIEAGQDIGNNMKLNFMLNLDDSGTSKSTNRNCKALSRTASSILIKGDIDDDTFENILQVTSQHDTIMAYYYMDENNKVKVTEIFDVTDSDSPIILTENENEINQNLEFDDDWNEPEWTSKPISDSLPYSENPKFLKYSLEEVLNSDTSNIFSDPESEWKEDEDKLSEDLDDSRPESDQHVFTKPYKIPSFNYNDISL